MVNELLFGENTFFVIWGIIFIVISRPIRRYVNNKVNVRSSGVWGSPERNRDRIISSPQFVGRLDRKKGLLETTARMVMIDMVRQDSFWSQQGEEYQVIRLRGELLDQNGSPLEYIPVEIRAKRKDWVGTIVDGDRIRVVGSFESDGILHADGAFNYSTNSRVGVRN
jgi:hypothetical protein